jgi:flavin reductase (DIM6/NTAB) family NADH-FMN oxidoreductase RutF
VAAANVVGVERTDIDPAQLGEAAFYKVLTSVVVPRPIAWVSTRSAAGVENLAPHSFFSVAAIDPPVVQFTSIGSKDSLRNVRETGEFVVNLAPAWMFEQVNATGTAFPPDASEFDAVGIARESSLKVAPPRVADSPVALECVLHDTSTIGMSTVVLGRVVSASIDTSTLAADGLPTIERLAPLARLGRNQWSELGKVLDITRIPLEEWPGHYSPE